MLPATDEKTKVLDTAIKTSFTSMFDLRYPLVCAPMFLVSNTRMVRAAAEAGIIGAFPALNYRPLPRFEAALQELKHCSAFGVNLIIKGNPHLDAQLDYVLAQRVPLIITSLGNPTAIIKKAHAAGVRVFCDVINLRHARKALDAGADGLVAVASGAGGHGGNIAAFALLPALTALSDRPVLAAGSIIDGRGLLAALALGAAGAYMGTRFIASTEAEVSTAYHAAILKASAEDIVTTARVDGYPGNFIKTDILLRHGIEPSWLEIIATRHKKLQRWLALYRARATTLATGKQNISYQTVFAAGQGVGGIKQVASIAAIVQNTVAEYHALKNKLP